MTTLIVESPLSLRHIVPFGHPERPERMEAVGRVLAAPAFAALPRAAAPMADEAAILSCHTARHLDAMRAASPSEGFVRIDADTVMSPKTLEAALHAVGGAVLAVDRVLGGTAKNAFSAARPPGHHAEPDAAMGFCFFNQAAIAARHAQTAHGLGRVAIVDFDVHHGNGTQAIFWADRSVLYASSHQMPCYPGTGAATETGEAGTIVNAPLPPGTRGPAFRAAYRDRILPALDAFAPELIVVSAGFDAHHRDPLAELELVEADFAWVTEALLERAERHAGGRLVSVLEGGYDLDGLAGGLAAHLDVLARA
ncbi:histone deacetylase family protein [Prosthecomicrobium pneumaticum]|uniref:Acetoin utilization deacetylase AcuC-like enzyme n=1 Tax=Prosthecomicrobium pneumaticum TaxID=81895 RepID=A0A7W9CV11_9HYPH|nr:histone deacetylase family protein [Prosthecomicrobium pneumaticum]MBB5752073.1 acetoin utilization deacetylase AcuC-like enzyme [Prosthecomicrobium pneumaticum]